MKDATIKKTADMQLPAVYYNKDKEYLPIMSKKDINADAENVALTFLKISDPGFKLPCRIDIEQLAEFYEIELDYADFCDKNILGASVFIDGTVFDVNIDGINVKKPFCQNSIVISDRIAVNNRTGRMRFTIGHEIGHFMYHAHIYSDETPLLFPLDELNHNSVLCGQDNIEMFYKNRFNLKEWQADYFSAALLMTTVSSKAFILNMYKKIYGRDTYEIHGCLDKIKILRQKDFIAEFADFFDVSFQAAFYRCEDLGFFNETNFENLF